MLLITNVVAHYRVPLFDRLRQVMDIDIVRFSDGSEWYWQGPASHESAPYVEPLPMRRVAGHPVVLGLTERIRRGGYSVVIKGLEGRQVLPATYLAARRNGAAFVLWAGMWGHPTTSFHRLSHRPTRWLYRHADAIITYGRHVSRYVEGEGADPDSIFVAPQANDFSLGCVPAGIKRNPRSMLYVGRLEPWKGWKVAVEVLDRLLADREQADLVVVGSGSGDAELEALARDPRRGSHIRWLKDPSRSAIREEYARAGCVLIPSVPRPGFLEPWSFVANEAMLTGAPVVATTAVGATADGLIAHRETGLVVPPNDVEQTAAAVRLLMHDARLAADLTDRAARAVEDYSYDHAVEGFLAACDHATRTRG